MASFTFAKLAHKVYRDLGMVGQFDEFVATGGSTTTIIDTKIALRPSIPEDDYYIDYTAIVVRDAGGASAAPEGEIVRVSDFVSSTSTFTVDTLTIAVASGDTIAICDKRIPLQAMYAICNRALQDLGDVVNYDVSLTTAANQSEYTLPEIATRNNLRDVLIQSYTDDSDDNQYRPLSWWKVRPPTTIGSTGILEIPPNMPSGYTLLLMYDGPHTVLSAYNSAISKSIHENLAIAAARVYAFRFLNDLEAGEDRYLLRREDMALQELEIERAKHPIWKSPIRHGFGLTFTQEGVGERANYPGDQTYYDR